MTTAHGIFRKEFFEPAKKINTIQMLFKAFFEMCSFYKVSGNLMSSIYYLSRNCYLQIVSYKKIKKAY